MSIDALEDSLVPLEAAVTYDELWDYMGQPEFNDSQKAVAKRTLAGVQSELELFLNRPLQATHVRETVWADPCSGIAYLSVTPVHYVIAIQNYSTGSGYSGVPVVGIVKTPMSEYLDGKSIDITAQIGKQYLPYPGGIKYFGYGQQITVEYVGGYIGYWDEGLKQSILRVAAREMDRNHDDTISLRGDNAQQASPNDPRPRGWTLEEKEALNRLRRRVIA